MKNAYFKSGIAYGIIGLVCIVLFFQITSASLLQRDEFIPTDVPGFIRVILLLAGGNFIGAGLYRIIPFKTGSFWNSRWRFSITNGELVISAVSVFTSLMIDRGESVPVPSLVGGIVLVAIIIIAGSLINRTRRPHSPIADTWLDKRFR